MDFWRKQQNGSLRGLIVAFFGKKQEWIFGGSNKMAAGRVPLLLFEKRAGMDFWKKQQNGSRRGPIVAF